MKLAMKGTREQRAQLVRANRMVAAAVLSGPKLTESEVEAFTKMGNVSEDVLQIIGTNRTWLKNYSVTLGLVKNPRRPRHFDAADQPSQRTRREDARRRSERSRSVEARRPEAHGESAQVERGFALPGLPLAPHFGEPVHVDGRALPIVRRRQRLEQIHGTIEVAFDGCGRGFVIEL